jgi:hypothetical protein
MSDVVVRLKKISFGLIGGMGRSPWHSEFLGFLTFAILKLSLSLKLFLFRLLRSNSDALSGLKKCKPGSS